MVEHRKREKGGVSLYNTHRGRGGSTSMQNTRRVREGRTSMHNTHRGREACTTHIEGERPVRRQVHRRMLLRIAGVDLTSKQ